MSAPRGSLLPTRRVVQIVPRVSLVHDPCLIKCLRFSWYRKEAVYVYWRLPWEGC